MTESIKVKWLKDKNNDLTSENDTIKKKNKHLKNKLDACKEVQELYNSEVEFYMTKFQVPLKNITRVSSQLEAIKDPIIFEQLYKYTFSDLKSKCASLFKYVLEHIKMYTSSDKSPIMTFVYRKLNISVLGVLESCKNKLNHYKLFLSTDTWSSNLNNSQAEFITACIDYTKKTMVIIDNIKNKLICK